VPGSLPEPVRRPPRRHRRLRPVPGSPRPGPGHHHPAAVHYRRVLQVRRRGGAPRALPGRPCPAVAGGLRVACRRPGPQRARRPTGRRWARPADRAFADLPARPERTAGIRGHRRGHRAHGPGARAPDADDHPPGRQPCPSSRANWKPRWIASRYEPLSSSPGTTPACQAQGDHSPSVTCGADGHAISTRRSVPHGELPLRPCLTCRTW
jgi:hypothetical protein